MSKKLKTHRGWVVPVEEMRVLVPEQYHEAFDFQLQQTDTVELEDLVNLAGEYQDPFCVIDKVSDKLQNPDGCMLPDKYYALFLDYEFSPENSCKVELETWLTKMKDLGINPIRTEWTKVS